jgi:hypothetical protein
MAKNITNAQLIFPAGVTLAQALSQGWVNMNTVVLSGFAPAGGLALAQGGLDASEGPGTTSPPPGALAGPGGGAAAFGQFAVPGDAAGGPGLSGNPGATATIVSGNMTIAQLMSCGAIEMGDFMNTYTFAAIPVQGGD